LADLILQQTKSRQSADEIAAPYLNAEVPTVADAYAGARDIAAETISDHASVRGQTRAKALQWAVQSLAKAGTLSIVGVYPEKARLFPIGNAVEKNLTMQMGNCPHRRYVPKLLELVVSGAVDPTEVLTQEAPLTDALEAYENFDRREAGWVKVMLQPQPSLTSR